MHDDLGLATSKSHNISQPKDDANFCKSESSIDDDDVDQGLQCKNLLEQEEAPNDGFASP
jgi:hypothetical protein